MLNNEPKKALKEIISRYGSSIIEDPKRLLSLLKDLCSRNSKEIGLLMQAVQWEVAGELASNSTPNGELLRARCLSKLTEQAMLQQEAAIWSLEAWESALGVGIDHELTINCAQEIQPQAQALGNGDFGQTKIIVATDGSGKCCQSDWGVEQDDSEHPEVVSSWATRQILDSLPMEPKEDCDIIESESQVTDHDVTNDISLPPNIKMVIDWSRVEDRRNQACPPGQELMTSSEDYPVIRTLDDLSEFINLIEPDIFGTLVNPFENKIADWVEEMGLPDLAQKFRNFPTPLRMVVNLEKFLQ